MSDIRTEAPESAADAATRAAADAPAAADARADVAASESASLIRVQLPAFEGPLDLLLHLIQRDEIDISDIPIARITQQYLETLELMRELDLEVAGEFLVMAATLMRIKARMLLPPAIAEEEEEDPREGLVRQLLEYRRFKEASRDLERLEGERRLLFDRGAPAQLEDPSEGELQPVSLFRLLDALRDVLKRAAPPIVHTITAEPISLEEAISVIRDTLRREKRALFHEVLSQFVTRIEKITAFLGLLELLKQERVTVAQEELFGPIWIAWRMDEEHGTIHTEEG
ncbi:MAG: segregation/condensation protein A [Candidatus Latescibacteria bacterium]|nr:segregation/condensation protein A [Candidatus Latescibacterota bacterium]